MRIAIVNDMSMAVEAMRRVLRTTRAHQVAWIARDGAEAVERCARDTPDVILMDLVMPGMDGVEATRRIMNRTPCAIVVVTASVHEKTSKVFEAMGAGAVDAVNTPVVESRLNTRGGAVLLDKLERISRLLQRSRANGVKTPLHPGNAGTGHLIAIGASAGGPAALARILSRLPADFPAAMVVVQHVDTQFAQGLADWLGDQTELPVRLAREGDHPHAGLVLLAGRDRHLVFTDPNRLGYTRHPVECSYCPSVDVFFESVERHWQGETTAVLLTGMGRDGAEGLRRLHARGHHTIVQDRASSAVYGMPKAATDLKAATEILSLDKIASRLANIPAQHTKPHA